MKADYDSQADALSIDLLDVPRWDDGEEIDDTYCNVALSGGRPANVELLDPRGHLDLLEQVAERFDLDLAALRAAAQAALAAPDRVISLESPLAQRPERFRGTAPEAYGEALSPRPARR